MSLSVRPTGKSDGSLDQYLNEINQYTLIDRDEEVRLAEGIRAARK